jgi:hypothetical protein
MKRTRFPEPTNQEEEFQIGIPSINIPSEALFHPNLNNTEKLLFGILTIFAQGRKGCNLSNRTLGNFLSVGKQTISNAISNLEQHKFIVVKYKNKNKKTYRSIFINPQYKILYHQLVTTTHDQLFNNYHQLMNGNFNNFDNTNSNNFPQLANNDSNNCYQLIGIDSNSCCELTGTCYQLIGTCYQLIGTCYQLINICYQMEDTNSNSCSQLINTCYELIEACYELIGSCYQLINTNFNNYPYKKIYIPPYKKIYRYIYYINNINNKEYAPFLKNGACSLDNLISKSKQNNSPISKSKQVCPINESKLDSPINESKQNNSSISKSKLDSPKNEKYTWDYLISKYGKEQVKFVKYFLRRQKKQFPNFIKDKISPNNSRVLTSLDCLDKLQRIDGFDFETEIKPAIELALNDPFWARNLLSLGSLRNKGSNGEKKFINIQTTLSYRSTSVPSTSSGTLRSPQDVINEQSWEKDIKKLMEEKVFTPVLRRIQSESEKIQVVEMICALNNWLIERQKRPAPPKTDKEYLKKKVIYDKWLYLPKSHKVIIEFVSWLLNQTWINGLKPGHFDPEGKTFRTFLDEYQRNIGFDILEGRRLS